MVNWNAIGVMLQDDAERGIVREAAVRCGLVPVDVSDPDAGHFFRSSVRGIDHRFALEDAAEESRWLPLIVADEQSPLQTWRTVVQSRDLWASAIVLVRDSKEPSIRHYADSSDPGPEAAYAWVLERPLRLDSVIVQIQQAVRANRVFLSRYHQVIEDLYRSRTIFDSVQNGISLADAALPDMPLVYVNPAFERMTGYTAAEVYGSNCRFLQGAETDQPAIAEIQAAMHERRPVQVLMRNYRKDGTPFWNELQLSPIRGLDGQVTHFVGIQNDVTERVEATQRLEQLAYYDALTKLANRTLLAEQLKQALARAKRSRTKLAVVLFKLDNLMQINCDFGRHAGDSVLRVMAMRLKQTARDHETAARLEPLSGSGGNEFVVVLEELVDEAQHLEATRRLSAALREPIDFEGTRLFPGFRVGAALFPRHGYQPDKLLDVARDQVEEPHLDASTAAALHS